MWADFASHLGSPFASDVRTQMLMLKDERSIEDLRMGNPRKSSGNRYLTARET
jgi:hypothetical protein